MTRRSAALKANEAIQACLQIKRFGSESPILEQKIKKERKKEHSSVKKETTNAPDIPITPSRKRIKTEKKIEAKSPKHEPKQWKEQYEGIKEWRLNNYAPVDDMGCERLATDTMGEKIFRYQTLVSLQLSSQTKDTVNAEAMANLKAYEKGLTPQSILEMSDATLNSLISKVGFHNRKTQYLKQTAKILIDQYDGDIPSTLEHIMALPGVGPKMAHLAMQCAWNINSGIGVDTHVHRISNRLGWVKTKAPEETRRDLEDWLPKELWKEVNPMLVGFGQSLCIPIGPKCQDCPVKDICPKIGTRK